MSEDRFSVHILEESGKKYYCAQHVAKILKQDGGQHLSRIAKKRGMDDIILSRQQSDNGLRPMTYIGENSLKLILARSQKIEAIELAKHLGFEILIPTAIQERHCMKNISDALPHLKLRQQVKIGKYRLDGYSEQFNLIIECDENDHKHYNQKAEAERTEYINRIMNNPKWVRFNPEGDIFKVIGRISILTQDPEPVTYKIFQSIHRMIMNVLISFLV